VEPDSPENNFEIFFNKNSIVMIRGINEPTAQGIFPSFTLNKIGFLHTAKIDTRGAP
jgi:hypothetical protein